MSHLVDSILRNVLCCVVAGAQTGYQHDRHRVERDENWSHRRKISTQIFLTSQLFLSLQQVNESPENLKYLWYPELEIYGLETFGRQRVLKEMSGVRIMKNKTINYELG